MVLCMFGAISPLAARTLVVEIDRLATPLAQLDGLVVTLAWPEGAEQGALSLTAASLDAGAMGYRWRNLVWSCTLKRPTTDDWHCAGKIKARGASGVSLSARLGADALVIEMGEASNRLRVTQGLAGDDTTQLELARIPATWLAPLLAQVWADGHATGGLISANWRIQSDDNAIAVRGPLSFSGLGVDSKDGTIAAEGVAASGRVEGRMTDTAVAVDLALELNGGEFLFGPMYVSLPSSAVQMAMKLASASERQWDISSLSWQDPGVLDIKGQMRLDLAHENPLRDADLQAALPALTAAVPRYFDSIAASIGLSGLQAEGAMQADISLRNGDWHALDSTFDAVALEDGAGRFGVEGLSGALRVRQSASAANSELSWQRAHIHGLSLGAAALTLQSSAGGLALRAPVAIPMLGGILRLRTFSYSPDDDDMRLDIGLALEKLNLTQLSAAFDWPPFGGTISGELPQIHYADERLDFEGGLSGEVFDGRVSVSQLSMERPFGVAPMLAASIEFSGLDLEPLTSAFGFGEITGRLDGHVRDLRLLDWEPVAFDAALHTVKRSGERRRISQRAVRELTEVGGGGIAAGLQAQVLQVFSSFGYERIGLSCVLANNVCIMGGAGRAENGGYVIVEGSGLPRVSVIGHQQRVDWPVLLNRLKAASEGQMPVID